jgi:hypothetical protein
MARAPKKKVPKKARMTRAERRLLMTERLAASRLAGMSDRHVRDALLTMYEQYARQRARARAVSRAAHIEERQPDSYTVTDGEGEMWTVYQEKPVKKKRTKKKKVAVQLKRRIKL